MRRRILRRVILIVVWMAFLGISCAHRYTYQLCRLDPPFDYKFIKEIAVLEFSNYTGTPGAGKIIADRIEQYLINETDTYKVITRMELGPILREHNLGDRGILSSATAKKIGKIAGVDALLIGNVHTYGIETKSWIETSGFGYRTTVFKRTANVSFTFKILNTMTGEVAWSDTAYGSFWRQASEDSLGYLDEMSEYEYFQQAIFIALKNHVRSIFPYAEWVKVRVKKK
jgi:hypothetical protein